MVNLRNVKTCKGVMNREKNVIQAPGFTAVSHHLSTEEDLIVFMVRRWSDIVKSLYRVYNSLSNLVIMDYIYEWDKFNYVNPGVRFNCTPTVDFIIGDYYDRYVNKDSYYLDSLYKMWKYYQRDRIKNWIQLNYESMKIHPNWIDRNLRKNFKRTQTTL